MTLALLQTLGEDITEIVLGDESLTAAPAAITPWCGMHLFGYLVNLVAKCFDAAGSFFHFLSIVLHGLLPALLSPRRMAALTRHRYLSTYTDDFAFRILDSSEPHLMPWESDVLDRYKIRSGRMLVLGSGLGRETFAMARRGLEAVGMDSNEVAIRAATRLAVRTSVQARFQQADFLSPPYRQASFDYVLLSSIMYSAIPGRSLRQAWLRQVLLILKPAGLVILSYEARHHPRSRLGALRIRITRMLASLPGANPAYQPGDNYEQGGHFMHTFQNEEEIRDEFTGAGVSICEVDWKRGVAVLTAPPVAGTQLQEHVPVSQAESS